MQQIIPITQLISRANALGLPKRALAKHAGLAISTVFRVFERQSCNSVTLERLNAALLIEENRLREKLEERGTAA